MSENVPGIVWFSGGCRGVGAVESGRDGAVIKTKGSPNFRHCRFFEKDDWSSHHPAAKGHGAQCPARVSPRRLHAR